MATPTSLCLVEVAIMEQQVSLLLVDDEIELLPVLSRWFTLKGYNVTALSGPVAAEKFLSKTSVDVALIDQRFHDGDGRALVDYLFNLPTRPGIVVHSGIADAVYIAEVLEAGADEYLVKPCSLRHIEATVREVVVARATPAATFCKASGE